MPLIAGCTNKSFAELGKQPVAVLSPAAGAIFRYQYICDLRVQWLICPIVRKMTTPIVLPWPFQTSLEAAPRALLAGDRSYIDFSRPTGEAALVSPDLRLVA